MRPLAGELLETRVHPVLRNRFPTAVPGVLLAAWGVAALASALSRDGGVGPWTAAAVIAPAGLVAALFSRWTRTAPFPPVLCAAAAAIVSGVLGLSAPVAFSLLTVAGLSWIGAVAALRMGHRVDLTTHGVIVQSGWLSRPVRFLYSEIIEVEARRDGDRPHGALVLQTEHGMFPLAGLPSVHVLEGRIRTRMQGGGEPPARFEDAIGVAHRLKSLLRP